MRTTQYISVEELAGNLTEVLNKVREAHTILVVEYASGEKLVIKPLPPTKKKTGRSRKARKADQEAGRAQPPRPSAHLGAREDQIENTFQHPQEHELAAGEASVTGAVYELDPQSLTAG